MSKGTERKLSTAEAREWLAATGQVRRGPHKFQKKICHWPYCSTCGLLLLKNEATRIAARAQCEWEE